MKRATIVGERTAGAGHNVMFVQSGHGFQTGISFTRVADPRTGEEWEQVGVPPDIAADTATALGTAHRLALLKLAETAEGFRLGQLKFIAEVVGAQTHPPVIAPALLASYVGTYEGGRRVSLAGERLIYEAAPGAPREALIPISESTFVLPSGLRFVFERDGRSATQLRIVTQDGKSTSFAAHSERGPGPGR
jgi:hypothetical protein